MGKKLGELTQSDFQKIEQESKMPIEWIQFIVWKLLWGSDETNSCINNIEIRLSEVFGALRQCEVPGVDVYYSEEPYLDVEKFQKALKLIVPSLSSKIDELLKESKLV